MESARTRSKDRALPGYGTQKDSKRNPNGFRGKRNPGRVGKGKGRAGKGKIEETHSASYHASPEDKERARVAAFNLRGDPHGAFVFNATLNLLARGEEPKPPAVRAEAQEIASANDAFFAAGKEAT